jgi:hypothetical protein
MALRRVADTEGAARRAQQQCRAVLAKVVELEREIAEIFASLPEMAETELNAMCERQRPQSLLFFIHGMLACIQDDDVRPLRESLERLVNKTAEDLEREW